MALEFYHVFFVSMVELRQVVFAAYDHADTKLRSLTIILKIDQNVARWLNVDQGSKAKLWVVHTIGTLSTL